MTGPHGSRFQLVYVLSALLGWACTTYAGGSGGGGGFGIATVPGSGGPVESSCASAEEVIACTPDNSGRVRCKDGTWLDDGACLDGSTCAETKAQDGSGKVIATTCVVPPTADAALAAACARYDYCYKEGGVGECVRAMASVTHDKTLLSKFGLITSSKLDNWAYLQLPGLRACVLAAKDCAGVSACFTQGVAPFSCEGDVKVMGCAGTRAYFCEAGVPLSFDCAIVGLPCYSVAEATVFCGHDPGCQVNSPTLACSGSKATVCVPDKSGGMAGVTFDCAAQGATCQPEIEDDDPSVCGQVGAPACDGDTFVERCEGNVRVRCDHGRVVKYDCGIEARVCAHEGVGVDGFAYCREDLACPLGEFGEVHEYCEGEHVLFCDGKRMVSLDCAAWGMTCQEDEFGGRCRF